MENKARLFTKEQEQWIKDNCYNYKNYKLMQKDYETIFNDIRTYNTFKHKCRKLGLHSKKTELRFTPEQDKWLIDNIDNYSRKEITKEFNKYFKMNRSENTIKIHCNRDLKIYFTTNYERFIFNRHIARSYPIGSELITSNGYIRVKVKNDMYNQNNNWIHKERIINDAKDDQDVIILDHDKPITKENTMVASKGVIALMTKNKYHNLDSELKKIAIKNCELKLAINKLKAL